MKLILTDKDVERLVYNAFVDGGLTEFGNSDIELKFFNGDYEKAKNILKADTTRTDTICYEDVLVQLFRDGKLVFIDHNDGKKYEFTPAFVTSNLTDLLSSDEPNEQAIEEVLSSLKEDGDADAWTHYNILQWAMFKELVYG